MKSILLVYLCILVYLFMVLLENRCACLAAYQILCLTRANAQTARERGGCSNLLGEIVDERREGCLPGQWRAGLRPALLPSH